MNLLEEATSHMIAGRIDEAEALCNKIIASDPSQVGVHYLLGLIANSRGDFVGACIQADLAIARNAGVAEVYVVKAWGLIGLNDKEGAIAALQHALLLSPASEGAAQLLAELQALPE